MKKLFLPILAIASALPALAYSYTQVSDISQFEESPYVYYVIEAYNHNWHSAGSPTNDRILTMDESSVTCPALSSVTKLTADNISTAGLQSSQLWLVSIIADNYQCQSPSKNNGHNKGITLQLSNSDKYPVWAYSGTSLSTATASSATTVCEVFPFSKTSSTSTSGADEDYYFEIHATWGTAHSDCFTSTFGVNNSGTFGCTSSNSSNYWYGPMYGSEWTTLFRIWRVELTIAERLAALKEPYKAQISTLCSTWALTDTYSSEIDAVTADDEAALTAAEETLKAIVGNAKTAVCATYTGYFTIASNQKSGNPIWRADVTNNHVVVNSTVIDLSSIWQTAVTLDDASQSGFSITFYNPFTRKYAGNTTVTEVNASYQVQALSDSAAKFDFQANNASASKFNFIVPGTTNTGVVSKNRAYTQFWASANSLTEAQGIWTMSLADDTQKQAVYTLAAVSEKLDGKAEGTGLGEYAITPSYQEKYDAYTEAKATDFGEAATAYFDITETAFTAALNMPAAGTYLRIKGTDGYVTADQDVHDSADAPTAASVMWYSGETLVDYQNGFAMVSHQDGFAEDVASNTAANLSFGEGSSAGNYRIDVASEEYTSNIGLEYVNSLPVTLPSDGKATLIVPVALQIPDAEGCSFYVAVIRSDYTIRIHKATAGEVYAAHTAIIINGTAGTVVNMPIAYDASAALGDYVYEGSGSTLRTAFTATDGFTTYAKQTAASAASAKRRTAAADGDDAVSVTFTALTDEVPANTVLFRLPNTDQLATSHESITAAMPTGTVAETDDVIFNAVEGKTVTTSISELTADSLPVDDAIYDLMGRRVVNPGHGIFIKNNKIFMK